MPPKHDVAQLSAGRPLETDVGPASPARRQLLALGTAMCGATIAGAIFGTETAQADLVAKLGHFLYLDPIVLNFALEMEELEKSFFTVVPASQGWGELSERERDVLGIIANQDCYHFQKLAALTDKLGYKDSSSTEGSNNESLPRLRRFHFPSLKSRQDVLLHSLELKETVLFAYHGAVGLLHNKEILGCAAAIAGVEGRHATVLRLLYGIEPVTAPFEGANDAQTSGNKLAAYGFKGGGLHE